MVSHIRRISGWPGWISRGLALAVALAAVAGPMTGAAQGDRQTVRIGLYQNEPKLYRDERGAVRGIFPDFLQAVADAEGWQLVYVFGSWSECLERLRRSEIDLMPDVCFTEDRASEFAFNRIPVIADWFGVYAPAGRSYPSLLDLENHRVAVLAGSIQETLFHGMVDGFGLNVELPSAPDYDTAAQMVCDGRADVMVCNRYANQKLKARYGLRDTSIIFNPTKLHVAAPGPGQRPLLDAFDRHLAAWKADPDSLYYRSLKRYAGDGPESFIPRWLQIALLSLAGALAAAGAGILALKWQVNRRTVELRGRTGDLERAVQSLKAAQSKAVQQERLHVLGQMASGVAHDFNNVLTPVIGLAELLLEHPAELWDVEKVKKDLTLIAEAGRDGEKIVARMQKFYRQRRETPTRARVLPADVARSVKSLMQPRWERMPRGPGSEILVITRIDDVPPILADETELRELLVNLICNALDAMPQGGTLTLSVYADRDAARFCVEDTGEGMTEDVQARCFDAFYSTKGAEGTGIGLTMVQSICDRYGGRIELQSTPGKGTRVCAVFPIHRDADPELPGLGADAASA